MNRNVTILIIILLIVVIAGYLVWLRGKFQVPQNAASTTPTPEVTLTPTVAMSPTPSATPSAMPKVTGTKPATSSAKTTQ